MRTEDLKILLALEPKWTISLNGLEFLTIPSAAISLDEKRSTIQFGRYGRTIVDLEWLRPNVVRIHGRARVRAQLDTITLYPGERLPSSEDLRRRRRSFQTEIGRAICRFLGVRK